MRSHALPRASEPDLSCAAVCGPLDRLSSGLIGIDPDHRIALWNQWMVAHSGIARAEAQGRALNAIMALPPMFAKALLAAHGGQARVLTPALNAVGLPLHDSRRPGEPVYQRLILSSWQDGGVLIEIHDVSAAWRREQLLRERAESWRSEAETHAATAEEARKLASARSRFFASMSHELRSPLNAIIGFAQLLQMTENERFSDKQRGYIDSVLVGGRHLQMLIDDVLDMARLEAGHLELTEDDINPTDLISSVLERISVLGRHRKIVTRVESTLPAQTVLRCDIRLTERMLTNLLANAYKFSPVGGTVRVQAMRDGQGALVLAVTDTGCGIARDKIAEVLAPFGQTEAGRRAGGTGLGLSIVAEGMTLHDGMLEIDSDTGKGLTARMVFPARRTRLPLWGGSCAAGSSKI